MIAAAGSRVRLRTGVLLSLGFILASALNLTLLSRLAHWLDREAPEALPKAIALRRSALPAPDPAPAPRVPVPAPAAAPAPAPIALPALTTTSTPDPGAAPLPIGDALADLGPLPAMIGPALASAASGERSTVDEADLDEPVRETTTVPPRYPPRARRSGASDTVTVSFVIRADGSVADLSLVSARHPELFQEPSFSSIRESRFAPGMKSGRAVDARCTRTFRYVLPDR